MLAAIAAKGVKELTYHRDYAGRWFLTPGPGHRGVPAPVAGRADGGLAAVRRARARRTTAGPDVDVVLDQVFAVSGVDRPEVGPMSGRGHTEALSRMLAEMQVVARAHPQGLW